MAMSLFDTAVSVIAKAIYHQDEYFPYLVVSARHEEMEPFLSKKKWKYVDKRKTIKTFKIKNSKGLKYNVLSYSIDKMGMPVNGVAISKIIEQYTPRYVIFIGTCAGLKPLETKEGDVLIPEYLYAYDSGKYNDKGKFQIEHRHFDVSQVLRSLVADMLSANRKYNFKVELDCGFCSGSSVISNKTKRNQIIKDANRKVLGFDMEAYVISVIHSLFQEVDAIVIKGIMDFGEKKDDKFKDKANANASRVAEDLITYMTEHESITIK